MVINRRKAVSETSELERLNRELRSLVSQLSLAEENERRRIAVELHDWTNETLVYSIIKLAALSESVPDAGLAESISEVRQLLQKLVQETRLLTFELSPSSLYYLGLEAAVRDLTDRMAEKYGLQYSFEDYGQPKPLDADVRIFLFQSARELLTNVAKHAQAQTVKVLVRRSGGRIQITVQDDGVGFDAAVLSGNGRAGGFGLLSIRERLHHVGG